MEEISPRGIYKTSEVCKFLNLGANSLGRRVRQGEITASKIGRGYLFTGEAVISFIKSTRVTPFNTY
jgi:excisionase family DNA binding protein